MTLLSFDQDDEFRDRLVNRLVPYGRVEIEPQEDEDVPNVVFEWNRTDTSQFEASAVFDSAGSSNPALSVVPTPFGNALQLSHDSAVTSVVFLTADPIVFPDDRRNLLFEFDLYSIDAALVDTNRYFGVCVLGDNAGDFHGLVHLTGSSGVEWGYRVDAGALVSTGSTGSGPQFGFAQIRLRGNRNGTSRPYASSHIIGGGSSAAEGATRRTGSVRGNNGADPFGNGTDLPAGWDSLALDRIGIGCRTNTAVAGQYQLLSFRVILEDVL